MTGVSSSRKVAWHASKFTKICLSSTTISYKPFLDQARVDQPRANWCLVSCLCWVIQPILLISKWVSPFWKQDFLSKSSPSPTCCHVDYQKKLTSESSLQPPLFSPKPPWLLGLKAVWTHPNKSPPVSRWRPGKADVAASLATYFRQIVAQWTKRVPSLECAYLQIHISTYSPEIEHRTWKWSCNPAFLGGNASESWIQPSIFRNFRAFAVSFGEGIS